MGARPCSAAPMLENARSSCARSGRPSGARSARSAYPLFLLDGRRCRPCHRRDPAGCFAFRVCRLPRRAHRRSCGAQSPACDIRTQRGELRRAGVRCGFWGYKEIRSVLLHLIAQQFVEQTLSLHVESGCSLSCASRTRLSAVFSGVHALQRSRGGEALRYRRTTARAAAAKARYRLIDGVPRGVAGVLRFRRSCSGAAYFEAEPSARYRPTACACAGRYSARLTAIVYSQSEAGPVASKRWNVPERMTNESCRHVFGVLRVEYQAVAQPVQPGATARTARLTGLVALQQALI